MRLNCGADDEGGKGRTAPAWAISMIAHELDEILADMAPTVSDQLHSTARLGGLESRSRLAVVATLESATDHISKRLLERRVDTHIEL